MKSLAENTDLILLSNGRLFEAPGNRGTIASRTGSRILPTGARVMLETTYVGVNVTMAEVMAIFGSGEISLPDKMRRAVLEPLDAVRVASFDSIAERSRV